MMFQAILLLSTSLVSVLSVHHMFDTMNKNSESAAFDCLDSVSETGIDHYVYEKNKDIHFMRFCRFQPMERRHQESTPKEFGHGLELTFYELHSMNVSSKELLKWFAPLDIIEAFISGEEQGVFVNCSKLWFGPQCQYTFDEDTPFPELVHDRYTSRWDIANVSSISTGTCFQFDAGEQCESVLCLDWREICDGKIDCANGIDEWQCEILERNECDPNTEYRCLNGHCIDKAFYFDRSYDCMDYSDEIRLPFEPRCAHMFAIQCEDRICPSTHFSCGDGECIEGGPFKNRRSITTACNSERDVIFYRQLGNRSLIAYTHITLIYEQYHPTVVVSHVCYNETICPYLSKNQTTVTIDGATCRTLSSFTTQTYVNEDDLLRDLRKMTLPCALFHQEHCSEFQCDDKSKCLSHHRLSDGYEDCSNGEDEQQTNVCLLGLPYRFQCDNGTRCISQTLVNDFQLNCDDGSDEGKFALSCADPQGESCRAHRRMPLRFNMTFGQLCNNIIEQNLNGYTDESDCLPDEWPCRNPYTTCNGVWNCLNGHDELHCERTTLAQRHCNGSRIFCLNPFGFSTCLPSERANDGQIDCLGSSDERVFCRLKFPNDQVRRYRCRNSDICISPFQVCNCHNDCPENDDEIEACLWLNNGRETDCNSKQFRCRNGNYLEGATRNRCDSDGFWDCPDGEKQLFCDLIDRAYVPPINLLSMQPYPLDRTIARKTYQASHVRPHFLLWHCNHGGLLVYQSNNTFSCFCSTNYYGERCQHQRKRLTVVLQFQMNSSFDFERSIFKIAILLMQSSQQIVSHEQIVYVPQRQCLPKFWIPLVYSINSTESYRGNHSIHILVFSMDNLQYHTAWQFPIPFEFLPVYRIAKKLIISETASTDNGQHLLAQHCLDCSPESLCLGFDRNLQRELCICPLGRIGRRCLIEFDPCTNQTCNGHGTCTPIDIRLQSDHQFLCLCEYGWYGNACEHRKARIYASFSSQIVLPVFSSIVFVHALQMGSHHEPRHLTHFYRLVEAGANFTFVSVDDELAQLIFVQVFENRQSFDYYLLFLQTKAKPNFEAQIDITSEIRLSQRCAHIRGLLNSSIIDQFPLRRVKSYQRPCKANRDLRCFYDEKMMCLCDQTGYADCFNFEATSYGCGGDASTNHLKCSSRGTCVQDHELCPTNSLCLCEPCSYGEVCQFTTNGYTLSFDAILGSHLRPSARGIRHQTSVIQIVFTLIVIFVTSGVGLSALAIGTFAQQDQHTTGSRLYLLVSSIFGLLSMVVLLIKSILFVYQYQTNLGCLLTEFLLRWLPTGCEWLNMCVAVERAVAVLQQASFSRSSSKRVSVWVVSIVLLGVGLLCAPELVFRRVLIDDQDKRAWCVSTLNSDTNAIVRRFYSVSNIILYIIPIVVNFGSTIIIIRSTVRSKQRTVVIHTRRLQENARIGLVRQQLMKHKHIIIGSLSFGVLGLPRLIFAFIFVCAKLDRRPIANASIYLVGLLPSIIGLFAFILPSVVYRQALNNFYNSMKTRTSQAMKCSFRNGS